MIIGAAERENLFDLKIQSALEGLTPEYSKCLNKLSKDNALSIATYISAARSETSLSDNYRRTIIKILSFFSLFCKNKSFESMTRNDEVLPFLDRLRKPESVDPMHKWVGTHNLYHIVLVRFFKWLYYPDMVPKARPKPPMVENIGMQRRREISTIKPTDLWTPEDDSLFLKYCPSKRIKCYHTVSRDSSCKPHEILGLKLRDIVFKTSGNYQYAEVLVNGKTGGRHIPLINSIPHVKDYLDHEHPQPDNPNAPFICGIGKSLGRSIGVTSLYILYDNYKKEYFPKLLDSPNVPPEDKQKITELLKKPWNTYIRRHSSLTEKAKILKEPILKMHAGWSARSQTHLIYEHWFGNESSNGLLEAYGIISKDKQLSDILRPKQCPNCNEPNKPDTKFCAKCRMVLHYDSYLETLELEKQKEDKLTVIEERFNTMQTQLQTLLSAVTNMKDQDKLNEFARTLFESGIVRKIPINGNE
jgi:integrase